MEHFTHSCMHMAVPNMQMRLDRFLDESLSLIIFLKLRIRF